MTIKQQLNQLHEDIVGNDFDNTKTDIDKIVEILVEFERKIDEFENHTHRLT